MRNEYITIIKSLLLSQKSQNILRSIGLEIDFCTKSANNIGFYIHNSHYNTFELLMDYTLQRDCIYQSNEWVKSVTDINSDKYGYYEDLKNDIDGIIIDRSQELTSENIETITLTVIKDIDQVLIKWQETI